MYQAYSKPYGTNCYIYIKLQLSTVADSKAVEPEIETTPIQPIVTPKRQITDAQREHLNKIRELAMQKKKELKEITLNQNQLKQYLKKNQLNNMTIIQRKKQYNNKNQLNLNNELNLNQNQKMKQLLNNPVRA